MLYSSQYDESEKRREMAKNSLERYTHYYERWATNQSVWSSFVPESLFGAVIQPYNIKAPPDLYFGIVIYSLHHRVIIFLAIL